MDESPRKSQPQNQPQPHGLSNPLNHLTDPLGKALRQVGRVGRKLSIPRIRRTKIAATPGIEHHELGQLKADAGAKKATITCIDYCPDKIETTTITDLQSFATMHRPAWSHVRWINIDGLEDPQTIQVIAAKYNLHPLAIEDVLHVPQRPKVDQYAGEAHVKSRMFLIARMAQLVDAHYQSEQVSMFLGHHTVITIQQMPGDVWDPIRQRLNRQGSRLRQNDASFLVYSLLDAIVDHFFPILEEYGNQLEHLEDQILSSPQPAMMQAVHELKRHMLMIRRDIWPMREMVQALQREPHECLTENTRTYLRDVYDHAVQIIDLLETYREVATGLSDMYMSAMGQRMNEVMKVLTIMGTIFIPMTFVAGVYGMNFEHMPELGWKYSYPLFWLVCLVMSGGMIAWFRKRKWL